MSPLKSRAQLGKLASLEKQGKVPKGTLHTWISETPDIKDLPNHVKKSSSGGKTKKK